MPGNANYLIACAVALKTRSEKHPNLLLRCGNDNSVALPLIFGESQATRKGSTLNRTCLRISDTPSCARFRTKAKTGMLFSYPQPKCNGSLDRVGNLRNTH